MPQQLYVNDWTKWRYAYLGGTPFIDKYLYRYSDVESNADFDLRKKLTYCPAFAKGAVNEVRNSIYERMSSIDRQSSVKSYNTAVGGLMGGVDNRNSPMNYFIGTKILPELLVMAKVIICVDKPVYDPESSLAETYKLHPYLYHYCREQLVDWKTDDYFNLTMIRLIDNFYDESNSLCERERLYELEDGRVKLTLGKEKDKDKDDGPRVTYLDIPRIPVVIAEISNSLMEDIADYQIALMNLCSSDINYIHSAGFPFLAEQFIPFQDQMNNRDNNNESDAAKTIKIGAKKGRRYPKGIEFPEYISPPVDTLKASMEKQEQIKKEIRGLISLTLSNLTTARTSADSKQEDRSREETGLSYIGLELESAENQILEIWSMFEGQKKGTDRVLYPVHYNLKTTEEVLAEGNKLLEHAKEISSSTYRKEIAKKVAKSVFEGSLGADKLEKIFKEIDSTDVVLSDPEVLNRDVETGITSKAYAAKLRGYPEKEVEVANAEHAERAKIIAEAQSNAAIKAKLSKNDKDEDEDEDKDEDDNAARGVNDLAVNQQAGKDEKKKAKLNRALDINNKNPQRGKGK